MTMTAPFMRAYTELLVATCHRRGAFAMGGMAAFIPSRRDPEVNERGVRQGARGQGARGRRRVRRLLGGAPRPGAGLPGGLRRGAGRPAEPARPARATTSEVDRGPTCSTSRRSPGQVTEAGLRNNIDVGLRYLAAWLGGNGAVGIHNLMEDAATAEISRSQIWQWVHNDVRLDTGDIVTADLVARIADEELADIAGRARRRGLRGQRFRAARELFEQVALADDFADFLTLPAYDRAGDGVRRWRQSRS